MASSSTVINMVCNGISDLIHRKASWLVLAETRLVITLTPPVDLVTLISYMVRIFWRSVDIHHVTLTYDPLSLNMGHIENLGAIRHLGFDQNLSSH